MKGELIRTIRHGEPKIIWADEAPEQEPLTPDPTERVCDDCVFHWGVETGHVYRIVEPDDCDSGEECWGRKSAAL